MAVQRKLQSNLSRLRDAIATAKSGTSIQPTLTETWTGPYADLVILQQARMRTAISTQLTPDNSGDGGTLTIVSESPPQSTSTNETDPGSVEVIWQELRLPVEQHPAFDTLSPDTKKSIRAAAESEDGTAPEDETEMKLYNLLAAGTTEYATGVPVVRRTFTKRSGTAGGGNAWIRDTPPVTIPGDWEWLKTADERRAEGASFTTVEEWTGAKKWDETLYPLTEEP